MKSVPNRKESNAIWEKIAVNLAKQQKKNFGYIEERRINVAAADERQNKNTESIIKQEFIHKRITFKFCEGRLEYENINSASLILEKDNSRMTELDGQIIELSVEGHEKLILGIIDGVVLIDFRELGIPLTDYKKIRYAIRKDGNIVDEGAFN
jgi:hypothetical protein